MLDIILKPLKELQEKVGHNVPLDGVAVAVASYMIPYDENQRLMNTAIIGVTHWILHEWVTCDSGHRPVRTVHHMNF